MPEDTLHPLRQLLTLWQKLSMSLQPACYVFFDADLTFLQDMGMRLRDGSWFTCFAANDINQDAQEVLLSDPRSPTHVFSGLLDCLPPDHQTRVDSLRPPPKANKATAAACYNAQRSYLEACGSDVFCGPAPAGCCKRHPQQQCPFFWNTDMDETSRPLKLNFSGSMCTPWTSHGLKLGEADPAMESWHYWILKMKRSGMDAIFLENSDHFPFSRFHDVLSAAGYECHFVIFSAEDTLRACFYKQIICFQANCSEFRAQRSSDLGRLPDLGLSFSVDS